MRRVLVGAGGFLLGSVGFLCLGVGFGEALLLVESQWGPGSGAMAVMACAWGVVLAAALACRPPTPTK